MKINKLILLSIGLFVFVIISYFLFIHYGAEFKLSKQVDNSDQVGTSKATQDLLDHPSLLIQKMNLLEIGEASNWEKVSNYEWHSTSNEYQIDTLHQSIRIAKEYKFKHQGLTIQLAHLPSRAEFWQLSISRF